MTTNYQASKTFRIVLSALALIALATNTEAGSDHRRDQYSKVVEFDVSEDANRFIFDETPMTKDNNGNDVPGDGNEFKTEGYIYEAGTLEGDGDGVNPDGSPQYPNKVVGRWYCWGHHVGNGGATETGPWVITHQLYDFGDNVGRKSIVSAGLELVDIDVPIKRAIVGGTGPYGEARGEVVQKMIGFNQIKGVNLRFRLKVKTGH